VKQAGSGAMDDAVRLLERLVATPSQAGLDDLGAIVGVIRAQLRRWRVPHAVAGAAGKPRAIVINPPKGPDDEVLLLNACVDTAPVGDRTAWRHDPFGAEVVDGWMIGRGVADSKAAVANFCELARHVSLNPPRGAAHPRRRVTIVFDCDEHSGRFGGIRDYVRTYGYPAHCAIGYPGRDEIVAGSRGYWRTVLTLRGAMGHSGSETVPAELATRKLAMLLQRLDAIAAPPDDPERFPIGPRASVTWLRTGARTHSVTASRIDCAIDVRLTPGFDGRAAQAAIDGILADIAATIGDAHPSRHAPPASWPAYRTPDDALLPTLMQNAAEAVTGTRPPLVTCGPSNIGNYLARQGTQVLAGYGVDCRGVHGANEAARLDSMQPVRAVYAEAVRRYLAGGAD